MMLSFIRRSFVKQGVEQAPSLLRLIHFPQKFTQPKHQEAGGSRVISIKIKINLLEWQCMALLKAALDAVLVYLARASWKRYLSLATHIR